MCNQTAGLIARALEENEITTVMISLLDEVTRKVRPPRILSVPFGFGQPMGPPGAVTVQTDVFQQALRLASEAETPETWWHYESP